MHDLTLEELKEKIVDHMDPDEFIEFLDIGIEDLVEAFSDMIEDNYERLIEEVPNSEMFGPD